MTKTFNYIKKNKVIDEYLTERLLIKFDKIFNENMYEKITPYICELKKNDISKDPILASLLNTIQKKFIDIIGHDDLYFEKLWLVYSKSSDIDEKALPYIPHIDKDRSFKAMIYLHDVKLENGPIQLGKAKKNIDTEKIRKKLREGYHIKNLNRINLDDIEKLNPMTGKAGDVIFFDTNTPHKAGIIKSGYFRKVLRFKFKRPLLNPKPFIFNRVIDKIRIKLTN
jgi:hypothetical protein